MNLSSTHAPSTVANCSGIQSRFDGRSSVAIKSTVLCMIFITALMGNIILITVIMKTKSLRRTMNYFLVNRAVADIIMPAFYVPRELFPIISGSHEWQISGEFGAAMCKLLPFIIDTASVVSILSMICITIDRFCAVVLPMKRDLITGKTRTATIILTWFLGILYTAPWFYVAKIRTVGLARYCVVSWEPAFDHFKSMTIQVVLLVVIFGIFPWILVCVLYTMMVLGVEKSKKAAGDRRRSSEAPCRQSRRSSNDARVMRLALTVVAVLAICNFPHCTMLMVVAFAWRWVVNCTTKPAYWDILFATAKYLVLANTAINPLICFVFGENFRKGLKTLLVRPKTRLMSLLGQSKTSNTTVHINALSSLVERQPASPRGSYG